MQTSTANAFRQAGRADEAEKHARAALNIDPKVEAEGPSIDFAGAGRTVPWDAWSEPNTALGGEKQIFASRFVPWRPM